MNPNVSPRRRVLLIVILLPLLACGGVLAAAAISNQFLPAAPEQLEAPEPLDHARVEEAFHLRETLGDRVWPGWGSAKLPIVLWNAEHRFLYGYDGPPAGWETLEGFALDGRLVYRQPASPDEQAFTEELVEGTWAGTLSTKWEIDSFLVNQFHDEVIPAPLNAVVPYRLLILPSEQYVTALLHETFHAYQATTARARFDDVELAYRAGDAYWQVDPAMVEGWQRELDTLIRALRSDDPAEVRSLAGEFLAARAERRASANLSEELVLFERRYEWLEGLAKYAEIGIFEAAAEDAAYTPVPGLAGDPFFQQYNNFRQRFSTELTTMGNQAGSGGDSRMYYTGMAQARILDQLMPGWKDRIMQEGVWLEDLLAEAVAAD